MTVQVLSMLIMPVGSLAIGAFLLWWTRREARR